MTPLCAKPKRKAISTGAAIDRCHPSRCLLGIPSISDSLSKKAAVLARRSSTPNWAKRDKLNSDLPWLTDSALEDGENLSESEALAAGIVEDLESTLEAFKPLPRILGHRQTI